MKTPNFIPDRLNEQPAVMRGCSWPEINSILLKSFFYAFPIGVLIAVFWGNYTTIVASVPIFFGVFFWYLTGRMANMKNGRPIGYFTIKNLLKKQRRGFKEVYIEHDGFWKISKDK